MLYVTVGCDPEAFFVQAGKVLPAAIVFNEIAGRETIETDGGNLIVDGAALEFQPNASSNPAIVVGNLKHLLATANQMARDYGTQIAMVPELAFDVSWCDRDPRLAVFGCSPDKSAWGESCQPATIDASKHPYRYAGAHIHLGPDREFFRDTIDVYAKALDRTVGLASMIISQDHDYKRRSVYGRPGVYRHQPWGMEYRTPSNFILRSPDTMKFILELAMTTVRLAHGQYENMCKVLPDRLVVEVLRDGNLPDAARAYATMANAFSLPRICVPRPVMWSLQWEV